MYVYLSLRRVFSSGPQLGNYLGALSNWVKLQNENPQDKFIFSIVGWHALTLPQNPKELAASRRDMLAVLLAIGIDPKRSILFHQDSVRFVVSTRWCGSERALFRTQCTLS
jgi:tryptophanyl-tRNA synthetase